MKNSEITETRFGRVLVLVAHPDDEAVACGGLLQRATGTLVVFATDGAPPGYGFEKKFGSLRSYSEERFREAARALATVSNCSFIRLRRQTGAYCQDQHLFLNLPESFTALRRTIRNFAPDMLVSHAYEGGHIDHDACNFLAAQADVHLGLKRLEFPLYSKGADGRDRFQQFRSTSPGEFALHLGERELAVKRRMLGEYRTQEKLLRTFRAEEERFRPAATENYADIPPWKAYPFENGREFLNAEVFVQKLREFNRETVQV